MGKPEIERFLSHLAVNRNVASSTQNQALRVRPKINLHFQALRRPHGKAREGRIAGYLTDEQRSHAGWIGASKCEVIFGRALRNGDEINNAPILRRILVRIQGAKGRISGYATLDATRKPDQKTKEMGPLFISTALKRPVNDYRPPLLDAFRGLILVFPFSVSPLRWVAKLQLPLFHFVAGSGHVVQNQPDSNFTARAQPSHSSMIEWQVPPLKVQPFFFIKTHSIPFFTVEQSIGITSFC
jgi:hypothetical protein